MYKIINCSGLYAIINYFVSLRLHNVKRLKRNELMYITETSSKVLLYFLLKNNKSHEEKNKNLKHE